MAAKPHFYGIDLVRFCAALLVVCFHLLYFKAGENDWEGAWFGWIGVQIFFVISGLVIANSAADSTAAIFVKNRALRLYPVAWICATIALLIAVLGHDKAASFGRYIRSMTLFPNGPWVNDVYWTLGVEIGFYILVFLLLMARAFTRINLFAAAITAISAVFVGFRLAVALSIIPASEVSRFAVAHEHVLNVTLMARHGSFFALGIFLWLSTQRSLQRWELSFIGIAVLTCIAEIALRSTEFLPADYSFAAALIPEAVWIVFACILLAEMRQWMPEWRSTSTIGALGLMTYPLYLVHNSAGTFAIKELDRFGHWIAVVIAIALVLAASFLIARFERGLRRWLASKWFEMV